MGKYVLLLWLCLLAAGVHAAVQVKATAPEEVEVGEQFRLSFTINTQDVGDFNWPEPEGFSVDMGPSRSSQSSFQMINGRTTQSSSLTYTYILSALKAGTYTIPAATATVEGKAYKSNTLQIKVVESAGGGGSAAQGGGSPSAGRMQTQDAGAKITGKDLFITVTADKQRLYEQEAVILTYKVYSLVNLSQLAGGMPDLDGFHTQEIALPQQKTLKMENHNGRTYGTVVWRQYVLFPQRSGKLTIPSIKFEGIVVQQNRNIDPIDAFFNGGSAMVEVKKTIVAPSLTLQVDPLPSRPENFSGAVGKFNISASLTPQDIKTNDALTLRVTVSGKGNMKLMQAPKVDFPKDFESYDPKVTDKSKVGTGGVSGDKVFEYVAFPRHQGKYTIPAVEFCYFDTDAKAYKTVRTGSFDVDVAKGKDGGGHSGNFTNQEDVKLLASDIRYIRQNDVVLHKPDDVYFGTAGYLWSYLVTLLAFAVLMAVFRKKAKENANVAKMRNKKANKVAAKRLKQAAMLLKANQPGAFYDEVLKALWGYVGDKLDIPVAELNKDNVSEKLAAKGTEDAVIRLLVDTMNDCEFARYAPGDPAQTMDKIYAAATDVIGRMESSIKR